MTQSIHSAALPPPSLSQRLTLMLAAAAIALAGLSASTRPARADAEDLLRFLAGIVVVAAIVNAIDDSHTPRYYGRWELPDSCLETLRVDGRTIQAYNARCLHRGGYTNLPYRCRYEFRIGGHRTRVGYIAECMWETGYRRANPWIDRPHVDEPIIGHRGLLPQHCAMTYRVNGQRRHGYWGHCLNDAGFHNLPRSCRRTTTDGDHLFNRHCLSEAGYRTRR